MTEKRSSFHPNQSPLDRIAELCEHPGREHSGAVALYLQERWEYERRSCSVPEGAEPGAQAEILSVPLADHLEHIAESNPAGYLSYRTSAPAYLEILNDLILALRRCRDAERLIALLRPEGSQIGPLKSRLVTEFEKNHPPCGQQFIDHLVRVALDKRGQS